MGFNEILKKLFGNKSTRDMKEIQPWVQKIKDAYPAIQQLDNDALRAKTLELKEYIKKSASEERRQIDELKKQVAKLYKEIDALKEGRLKLIQEKNELELALKEAEKHVCLQPDDKCLQRLNPNDHCRLRKILRGEYTKDHPDAILTEEDMKRLPADSGNNGNEGDKGKKEES